MDPTSINPPQQETVSQSEIENLLAAVGDADALAASGVPVSGKAQSEADLFQRYEFPQLSSFSAGELRKLRMRQEDFIRSLGARLSLHLRLECGLQMSRIESMRFQQFVEALANPTHLTLFKIEPLPGICLLDVPPRLGMCIVDRELGGPAVCLDETRDMSKMEVRLLSRVVELVVSEWCSIWSDTLDLRPVLLRHENNGRFLQTHQPDTMMLVLGMEARVGETIEHMHFGFPYATLEPLLLKLNADLDVIKKPAVARSAPLKWNSVLDDLEIQVTAELRGLEITANELAQLKPGDVLPLPPDKINQIRLCLATTPKFLGNLGTSGRRLAVKIVESFKT